MRHSLALLIVLMAAATSGCLGVQDSSGASLTLRFYFEYDDDKDTWNGPDQIEIWLYDVTTGTRDLQDHYVTNDFVPGDSLHYSELGEGLYDVTIKAVDTVTGVAWNSDCTGLLLDRFDEIYGCDVWLDDGSSAGDAGISMSGTKSSDAGMP